MLDAIFKDTYIFDNGQQLLSRSAVRRDSVCETRAMAESREMSTNFMMPAFLNLNDYQVECNIVEFVSTTVSYQFSVNLLTRRKRNRNLMSMGM